VAANTADLTTLAQVLQQLGPVSGDAQGLLQVMITSISRHIATRTGRATLNAAQTVTDTLDGSGGDKQFLREFPVQSVTSVSVFGSVVPPSTDGIMPGWVADAYSVMLLPGTSIGGPISYSAWLMPLGRFPKGRQNVKVVYSAGYTVGGGPTPFPPQDPAFNGAPSDLGQAVTEFVVQQWKKRDWVDIKSKTITNTGETISFRDWELPPWLQMVIQHHKRVWLV
jgi:hypothetical protein